MWHERERSKAWEGLKQPWDLVIVGGGIVGAGIFHEAVRLGLRSLLVEQRDFAWGTSSRSSKFVHCGLCYLKDLDIPMARKAIVGRKQAGLIDSYACTEAQTDDAHLTLRVINEGVASGGCALNYVRAEQLVRAGDQVVGVLLSDQVTDRSAEAQTRLVVNSTGAWADQLRGQIVENRMMRPQRGSHLVFPGWRLPVTRNVTINHPMTAARSASTPGIR